MNKLKRPICWIKNHDYVGKKRVVGQGSRFYVLIECARCGKKQLVLRKLLMPEWDDNGKLVRSRIKVRWIKNKS